MKHSQLKKLGVLVIAGTLAASLAAPAYAEPITPMVSEVTKNDEKHQELMDVVCGASGIAAMDDGNILVTDIYNKRVWKTDGTTSTVYAGDLTVMDLYGEPVGGYHDDKVPDSYFSLPWAVSKFLDGWAVSDADNGVVRLIRPVGVETVNGKTSEQLKMSNLGVAYEYPTGLATDQDGNLYVADTHAGAIRKITKEGKVTTAASGLMDPMGLCWKNNALYIAETGANRIIRLENGAVTTVCGSGEDGYADGAADQAMFSLPQGIAVGDDGTVYVSDTANSAIRRVRNGRVDTLEVRDRTSGELYPVSPVGLLIQGNVLYVCDSFARKVFLIQL